MKSALFYVSWASCQSLLHRPSSGGLRIGVLAPQALNPKEGISLFSTMRGGKRGKGAS